MDFDRSTFTEYAELPLCFAHIFVGVDNIMDIIKFPFTGLPKRKERLKICGGFTRGRWSQGTRAEVVLPSWVSRLQESAGTSIDPGTRVYSGDLHGGTCTSLTHP